MAKQAQQLDNTLRMLDQHIQNKINSHEKKNIITHQLIKTSTDLQECLEAYFNSENGSFKTESIEFQENPNKNIKQAIGYTN